VVFAEADQLDVLKAAQIVSDEGIAIPILLGRKETIVELMQEIEFDDDIEIIDPKDDDTLPRLNGYAQTFWEKRQRSGMTLYDAQKIMRERNYFAAMMVNQGDADGLISGYSRSYATVLKPMIETIGTFEGVNRVATTNLMLTKRGPLFLSDTAINIEPNASELAKIAHMTAYTMRMFGVEPAMAMISYDNFGSSKHPTASKVKDAVSILHKISPDFAVDGGLQTDFALNSERLQDKFPFSRLAGKKVNALVFPNLAAANSNYKLLKEFDDADSIGPIMLGMRKPVHILQLGASVEEIVNMVAVVVIDAQQKEKRALEKSKQKSAKTTKKRGK
jgi:malate dehydrogenase (oxaloacetate-decarboxylating)(NADP+)